MERKLDAKVSKKNLCNRIFIHQRPAPDQGRLLGQGTFAKVYPCKESESGQSVAIKVIDKEKVLKVGMIDQIKRENINNEIG
ncbi:Serine/threonine Kinase [Cinnamomum micranthum f. kanehirae]|uniref:Serine/threonine Kinase n=1 Tax=Cinnamomum micranthum f. kanehirae TaxID=337451 RepID=A0A3S3N4K0_9MAGN|nr:Serine/threonine Kinase [Cinnamomum micranthum f. kanehirae]